MHGVTIKETREARKQTINLWDNLSQIVTIIDTVTKGTFQVQLLF